MSTVTKKLTIGAAAVAALAAVSLSPVVALADYDNTVPAPGPGATAPANPSGATATNPSVGTAAGQPSGRASRAAAANAQNSAAATAGVGAAGTDPSAVIANPPLGYGPAPTPAITDFQPLPTWLGRAGSQPCQIIVGPYGTTKKGTCS